MSNFIDFYFDIISPYSYIAYKKILRTQNVKFNYKPILLGGLHKLEGITAPAFNTHKMKNMKNDCELVAYKNEINFSWNSKFPINSLYMMRGYLVLEEDKKIQYLDSFFNAYWKDNLDLNKKENIIKILENLEIDSKHFFEAIENKNVKDKLKKFTLDAFEKNIFGAPTFIVNKKMFWGQDRLEYALDEILK